LFYPEMREMGTTPMRAHVAALGKGYRIQGKSGKNDANDAAAVFEAASRRT